MKKVLEYLLKDVGQQNLEVPKGTKLLGIYDLNGEPTIFALVDQEQKETEIRRLIRVRSGFSVKNELDKADRYVYIGSVLVHSFGFAYHVFEEVGPVPAVIVNGVESPLNVPFGQPVANITVEKAVTQADTGKTPPVSNPLDTFKRK